MFRTKEGCSLIVGKNICERLLQFSQVRLSALLPS